jgi:hypothetical protein
MINEVCGDNTTQKNTSGQKQCLEGVVGTYALAKSTFSFATLAAMKTKAAWDTAKAAKDIVVFYEVEEREPNNTEAVIKNGRRRDFEIKEAVKGANYTHYLSPYSHEAIESFEDSDYTTIFRITDKNEVLCEEQSDGTIKGEPLKSFIVGVRDDAPVDGTPSTKVSLKFGAYSMSVVKPSFDLTEYEGIYDVTLVVQGVPTATTLVVEARKTARGTLVASLVLADWKFVQDSDGLEEAVTVSSYDAATGFYTLTGVAFETGTIATDGVIQQTEEMLEAAAVAVTI